MLRRRGVMLVVIVMLVAAFAAVPVTSFLAAPSSAESSTPPTNPVLGKQLYRQLCSQCHTLVQASPAGFGSDTGPGQLGGPSFNDLKISYDLAIVAVTEGNGSTGHRLALQKMTWADLDDVAAWLGAATKSNASARIVQPFRRVAEGPIASLTPSEITVQANDQAPTSCARASSSPAFTGFKVGDPVTIDCTFDSITWEPGVLVSITAGLTRPPNFLTPIPGPAEG